MISKQLDELVTSLSPEDREATLSTLRRIFDNIIQHPNDDKYRQIKLTDEAFSSKSVAVSCWWRVDKDEWVGIGG